MLNKISNIIKHGQASYLSVSDQLIKAHYFIKVLSADDESKLKHKLTTDQFLDLITHLDQGKALVEGNTMVVSYAGYRRLIQNEKAAA